MPGSVRSPVSTRPVMPETLPATPYGAIMCAMRALLAALAVAAFAVLPTAPAAAQAPAPVDGTWTVGFTAASVRTVGDPVRQTDLECGTERCGSSYQFPDGVG